ncbi:MAG: hypothetical protein ACP5JZ_04070 [Thermosulfidibacteraceae bacterium]|jgi:hypothetical protein
MSRDILRSALEELVHNFSLETLRDDVLYLKFKELDNLNLYEKELYHFEDEKFSDIREILTVRLRDNKTLKAFGVKVEGELSDRSSKKRQFELAKKILRTRDFIGVDAGLFTFYDSEGNFRFSLVHKIYEPGKQLSAITRGIPILWKKEGPIELFLKPYMRAIFPN